MTKNILTGSIVAIGLFMSTTAYAQHSDVSDVALLKTFPMVSSEELKQFSFSASITNSHPPYVRVGLHNPLRNKDVAAIVLTITIPKSDGETPTVHELFVRLHCGPLRSSGADTNYFNAEEARKAGAVIALKEVYYDPSQTEPAPSLQNNGLPADLSTKKTYEKLNPSRATCDRSPLLCQLRKRR